MTDKWEKASKGLECCLSAKHPIPCHKCDYYNNTDYNDVWSCRLSLMRDARNLLKAQEPIAPKLIKMYPHDIYECGNCGHRSVGSKDYKAKYCPECGRELKWE